MFSKFQLALVISVVFHVAIVSGLVFGPAFEFKEPEDTKVTWIKLSYGDGGTNKRANLKKLDRLPRSTLKEQRDYLKKKHLLKKLKETPNAKKLEIPKAKLAEQHADRKVIKIGKKKVQPKKKTIAKKKSRIDDALARIDERLKNREDQVLQIKKAEIGMAQTKDNSTGQSEVGGEESNISDAALVAYYNTLKRKIRRQWVIAKKDYTGQLLSRVVVMIDGRGKIIRTWFKKTSGDGSFDDSALRALRKAAPFPSPPSSIRKEALTEGFIIEFNPRTVTGRMSFR